MTQTSLILGNFKLNRFFMDRLLADVPDATLTAQPAGIINHAAWQTGHIIVTLGVGVKLMGGDVAVPDEWNALFGIGSTPLSDRSRNPSKAELQAAFNRVADAFEAGLAGVASATLEQQNPLEKFRRICPTIGDAVTLLATGHIAYHQGQLSSWRRAQGLGPIV